VDTAAYARWFRDSTPYISQHRNRTAVVLLGGDAIEHANLTNLVHDLALASILGLRLVLVHGARPQLDAALPTRRFSGGRRVTSADDMAGISAVVGQIRTRLEALFATGLPSSPLRQTEIQVLSGNFVTARPLGVLDGVDHEFTGRVRQIHADRVKAALEQRAIVLIPPIGYSSTGAAYNLPADELAADMALALRADKLITFDETAVVTDADGRRRPTLTPSELAALLDQLDLPGTTRSRLGALLRAVRGGVPRAVLLGYGEDGALLAELYRAEGHGTQISEDLTESVRPASAADISGIVELIRPLEDDGALVRRSRDRLEQEMDCFLVAEIDANVVGCCAVYAADGAAELACLAVRPSFRGGARRGGLGAGLLAAAEQRARSLAVTRLFVLTTQAEDWFREHGFEPASIEDLPAPRRSLYNYQRNSKVLIKALD